jgi:hypothetical protein
MDIRWMVVVSALAAVGCQGVEAPPPTISADGGTGGGGGNGGGNGGACEGPLGAPILDFSGMEACCSDENGPYGEAHCLEGDKVPAELGDYLDACESGGFCVPDQFLSTGGTEAPADCTAFGGPGVCLSECVPTVRENSGLLSADVCGGDQLCVPCISPLDQMPTGACDLGELTVCESGGDVPPGTPPASSCDDPATCEYEANCPALIDPTLLPECAADAHCLDAGLVPADTAAQLAPCDDVSQLCVPDDFIRTGGKFTPLSCASAGGAEGRCLSTALPAVADQADLLPQDICAATEKCTPCFNPLDGSDTGACRLACDEGPTAAPVTFASCCEGKAVCVPTASVPEDQQSQLGEKECEDLTAGEDLCVPNEIVAGGPFPACTASGLLTGEYTGVCLADCLEYGIQGLAVKQGDCAEDYRCAPCENPLSGEPTGAPGCPAVP